MSVKRIVADLQTSDPRALAAFYENIFDLQVVMDQEFIVTCANDAVAPVQISFASEGGSGTPVPALSIEVNNLNDTLSRVRHHDIAIEYGPVVEPWGVRRFFIRDPEGNLLNVLSHID